MAKLGGLLGGMGADVTAELLKRIINATGAAREQENIPLIINHNPLIPDRTQAIVYGGEDPLPHLRASLGRLVKAGVDFIAIPCNTAHYYYEQMQSTTPVPIIHMLKETVGQCRSIKPDLETLGLLATTGTVSTGLYQRLFAENGIEVLLPDEQDQASVMDGIMAIKARRNFAPIKCRLLGVARKLIHEGAQIILVGCTDLSLVVADEDIEVPVVDALSVLAEVVVRMAKEK